jgi:hypothetical protein
MRRRIVYLAAAVLVWQWLGVVSEAQLVQVGPGYVKAPFVRVYHYPDGSSFVRAPFVAIHSPGYAVAYPEHSVPTPGDLCEMSWRSLGEAIHESTIQLDSDLDQFARGENWRSRLKTSEIAALVPKGADRPPAAGVRRQLLAALEVLRAAHKSSELSPVVSLQSFQILEAALGEYVSPPDVRLERQLFGASDELWHSLGDYPTGGLWRDYLALSPGMALADRKLGEAQSTPSAVELSDVLKHYDSVDQNNDFRIIARLPAFKTTHELLAAFVSQRATGSSQPEELPPPQRTGR